ncbi:MAG: hypothetical protein AAGI08_03905 [Bacteroidota bacterium]
MLEFWERVFTAEAPAVLGVLGVVVGALLTAVLGGLTQRFSDRRQLRLRLLEKGLSKRIDAHEQVIAFAHLVCSIVPLEDFDDSGELERYPTFMHTRDALDNLMGELHEISSFGTLWLTPESLREINYAQDYLLNVLLYLKRNPEASPPEVGVIVRQDFVDLAGGIIRSTHPFFRGEIRRLGMKRRTKKHKYPRHKTEARLAATALHQLLVSNETSGKPGAAR